MLGVITNAVTVIIGSLAGLIFKKFISEKYTSSIMTVIGLCVLYIGIDGSLEGNNALVLILSIVTGTALGTFLDIDGKINAVGKMLENRFKPKDGKETSVAQGFVTASLLFCIGSMTIVGSFNAGINGDNTILFTKSIIDMFCACLLASSLGFGVIFSAAFVFISQGALVMIAKFIGPVIPPDAQAEIICAGSIMIIGIGLNLANITKIKVANSLPAVVIAPFLVEPMNKLLSLISN